LKQILEELGRESVKNGHHTSELQRRLQKQIDVLETIIVLDDLDFLLLNDADDLLYFISRLDADLGLVLVTAHHADLNQHLEERTYSTLQPQRVDLNPYTEKQAYEILADRAEKALKPQSLHREALNHIVSRTQNLRLALTWLRAAAEKQKTRLQNHLSIGFGKQQENNTSRTNSTDFLRNTRPSIGLLQNLQRILIV